MVPANRTRASPEWDQPSRPAAHPRENLPGSTGSQMGSVCRDGTQIVSNLISAERGSSYSEEPGVEVLWLG